MKKRFLIGLLLLLLLSTYSSKNSIDNARAINTIISNIYFGEAVRVVYKEFAFAKDLENLLNFWIK